MNRRNRLLVVVAVAIALASLASFGVYRAVQNLPVREVLVVERQMVVATQPIDVGMILTEQHVRLQPWPASAPVPGGFESLADVVGRGVTSPLVPNEAIIDSKLAPRDGGGGLSPTIPAGMRAMAVRVNDVIGVAGFAVPGTRVDVVVTIRGDRESTSMTVVNNVRVLAVGTRSEMVVPVGDARPAPTTVVTLLVSPGDAERLALAQSQGSIVLALRNPLDRDSVDTRGVRTSNLLAGTTPAPSPAPARSGPARPRPTVVAPPPPPADFRIETIKGAQRSEVVLKPANGGGARGAGSGPGGTGGPGSGPGGADGQAHR